VRFRPGGALPFIESPAGELVDRRPPLEDLWGARAATLLNRLSEAPSAVECVGLLEGALLEQVSDDRPRDLLVEGVVERLYRNRGALSVSALASSFGVSARQLRRRFDAAVGLSPKVLSRIIRLQRVLRSARSERRARGGNQVDWAAAAVDAGFYDQAHLINDFRDWTGMSPASYLAAR
jgi:AraC-like DNA-binding protein